MDKFNTKPPAGTRDFMPDDMKNRELIFMVIKEVFKNFGFLPIDTPAFERIETLVGKYGTDGDKLIFKILKRGQKSKNNETDLALRYDLTVPLARFFAQNQSQLNIPFRRYQISPVWRADRPGKGRFREFYQCDIDIIGSSSLLADTEVILALTKSLLCLKLPNYVVRLNSRKILLGLLETYNIPAKLHGNVLTAFDKLDKVGIDGVIQELIKLKLSKATIKQVEEDLAKNGDDLRKIIKKSPLGRKGLEEVDEIINLIKKSLVNGSIELFPFLARGLDYYTGPIFEIYLPGSSSAIASGGRYDNLIGMFTGNNVPACGGSLGIDRILSMSKTHQRLDESKTGPQIFTTVWDDNNRTEVLQIATKLRNEGISVEIFLGKAKISKQVKLASEKNALYCLFYGPDEQEKNSVTIKNLSTGEQLNIKRDNLIKTIKNQLKKQ